MSFSGDIINTDQKSSIENRGEQFIVLCNSG